MHSRANQLRYHQHIQTRNLPHPNETRNSRWSCSQNKSSTEPMADTAMTPPISGFNPETAVSDRVLEKKKIKTLQWPTEVKTWIQLSEQDRVLESNQVFPSTRCSVLRWSLESILPVVVWNLATWTLLDGGGRSPACAAAEAQLQFAFSGSHCVARSYTIQPES